MMQTSFQILTSSILIDLLKSHSFQVNVHPLITSHSQLDLVIVLVSRYCVERLIIEFSCDIGQRFAGFEVRVILSTLFRRFSFRSVQTIDELRLFTGMVLRSRVPIQMVIEQR